MRESKHSRKAAISVQNVEFEKYPHNCFTSEVNSTGLSTPESILDSDATVSRLRGYN